MRSMFAVVAAFIISISSAQALESSATVRSPLSPDELWKEVGDFCGLPAWDTAVEQCSLSADGKRRTMRFFGRVVRVEAEVEDWSEADRSFGWKNVSGLPSIANFHARVSVIADGRASALTWTASYEAKGISDAEARNVIDGAIHRSLCLGGGPLLCSDSQNSVAPAQMVSFESQPISSTPIHLRGYL